MTSHLSPNILIENELSNHCIIVLERSLDIFYECTEHRENDVFSSIFQCYHGNRGNCDVTSAVTELRFLIVILKYTLVCMKNKEKCPMISELIAE